MKKTSTLLFLSLCAATLNAQSYKTDRPGVSYVRFPSIIQDPDINTYSVKLDMNEAEYRGYGVYKSNVASMVKINAFSPVEVNGENIVEINLGSPANMRATIDEVVTKKDDKSYSTFYYNLTYSIPNDYKLIGPKGEIFLEGKVGAIGAGFTTYTYKSQGFQTREQCSKYFGSGQYGTNEVRSNIAGKVTEITKEITGEVQKTVDYVNSYATETIYSLKSGKKGDYSAYDKASEQLVEAFKLIKIGEDRTKFTEAASIPLSFWKSQLPSLDYKNKDQENAYTAATLNLATGYFWEDKLDSAQYFLDMAKLSGEKKGDVAGAQRLITSRISTLKELKVRNIDPYKGIGAANLSEINENTVANLIKKILEDPANFTKYQGQVIDKNGKLFNVTFKQYGELNEPAVAKWSNKLIYKAENSEQELEVNTLNVKYYDMDGQKYEYIRFYPSTEVSAPIQQMLKIVFDSPKIRVYEHDLGNTNNLAGSINILYKRPGEDIATNTSSVKFMFMFKKSLAKYFADCEAVKGKAESGTYGKGREQLVNAAKEYADCK